LKTTGYQTYKRSEEIQGGVGLFTVHIGYLKKMSLIDVLHGPRDDGWIDTLSINIVTLSDSAVKTH